KVHQSIVWIIGHGIARIDLRTVIRFLINIQIVKIAVVLRLQDIERTSVAVATVIVRDLLVIQTDIDRLGSIGDGTECHKSQSHSNEKQENACAASCDS